MLRSTVGKYLCLTWHVKKLVFTTAMSYKTSFLVQIFGMFFNDGAWILLWSIFFNRFPVVNGWRFEDTIILYAFGTIIYVFLEFTFDGISQLARLVVTGELDIYLTSPKNILWSVAVSKSDIAALGDGLFGLVLMFWVFGLAPLAIGWFLLMASMAALLFFDFMLLIQSSAFWLGDIEDAAKRILHMLFGFMFYPQSIFSGALKIIMMTVLPAFFMVTVPVTLVREFSWYYFGILLASTIIGTIIALFVFHRGLARYESGNLMTTRQ